LKRTKPAGAQQAIRLHHRQPDLLQWTQDEALWGVDEWDFFLNDLKENFLNPGGVIALEFNEEPSIGFYTEKVRNYFESKFARIFRGRVIVSRDNLPSQPAPAASRVVATGSVL
jgi:hypothetical protein